MHRANVVRRNIAENLNRLSRAHERYRRQADRQTDRQTTDSRTGDTRIADMNVSTGSLKTYGRYLLCSVVYADR